MSMTEPQADFAQLFQTLNGRIGGIEQSLTQIGNDVRTTNEVLYGHPRLKTTGLVDSSNALALKIANLQAQISELSLQLEKEAIQKKAIEDNQTKLWNSVKLWGSLATAIMGIGQIINIITNLKP